MTSRQQPTARVAAPRPLAHDPVPLLLAPLYIGAGLGPGPRDGLTTGLAARGHSLRVVRTAIEVTVLASGWLLGGTVGVGTVLYATSIGPLTHITIPALRLPVKARNG